MTPEAAKMRIQYLTPQIKILGQGWQGQLTLFAEWAQGRLGRRYAERLQLAVAAPAPQRRCQANALNVFLAAVTAR